MTYVVDLRPPEAAGPLRIGADRAETVTALRQLGEPQLLNGTPGRRPSWFVHRPSGLVVRCHLDKPGAVEAIEFGRPSSTADAVCYQGIDVFGTPADELVTAMRARTRVVEEGRGYAFIAPDLLLSCWRATTPKDADDLDGRFFDSVLLARPGYYDPS